MRSFLSLAVILCSTALALADTKSVIVAPFEESNELQQPDWISRSLHQSLVDDVASIPEVSVLNASQPADPADAKYIVRGTIQRSDGTIRVTGRVEETAGGKTVGGFKSSGTERDLFAIQDSIAGQVRAVLGERPEAAAREPQQPAPAQQPAGQAQQPVMVANGMFEGSNLQRALMDRDYLRREAIRGSIPDTAYTNPSYGYQQPMYPYSMGGYPYWYRNGWGFGHYWGGYYPGVIVIRKGHHGGSPGGGSHGGGSLTGGNTQRLRSAAVFGHNYSGQGNMVASPTSGQARVGGGGGHR